MTEPPSEALSVLITKVLNLVCSEDERMGPAKDAPPVKASDLALRLVESVQDAIREGRRRWLLVLHDSDFDAAATLDDIVTFFNLPENKPLRKEFVAWQKKTGRVA